MLEGLYESLLTTRLQAQIDEATGAGLTSKTQPVDAAEQPDVYARHIRDAALRALAAEANADRRRDLVNALLDQLGAHDDQLAVSPSQLLSLVAAAGPGSPARHTNRPATPLCDAALLTNAHGEPSLGHEVRSELDSADQVDLLCAFVKWYGLRVIEPQLLDLKRRGVPLRVITTTYMGATERRALDRLVCDLGAEVKIQYDSVRTRLHAKAWLFRRNTGFNTAYVGSSNLSRAAMLDGVEWNVRLSEIATPPADAEVLSDVRNILERLDIRELRPRTRWRPAGRRPRAGFRTPARRRHGRVTFGTGRAALSLPSRDAGAARRRASGA